MKQRNVPQEQFPTRKRPSGVLNGWVESYMGASLAQAMHSRRAWFESETCPDTVISDVPYLGEICVSVCSIDPRSVAFCASIKALRIQISKIQFWHIFELSRQEIVLFFILLSFFFTCHSNNNSQIIKTRSIFDGIYILFFFSI